jgi:membrane glycosyltransferase
MDSLSEQNPITQAADERNQTSHINALRTKPAMPAQSPLDMPTQPLKGWTMDLRRKRINPEQWITPSIIRLGIFGAALLLTLAGSYQMYKVVDVGTITILQWVLLVLFTINFSWIALACTSAAAGFIKLLFFKKKNTDIPLHLERKTAVVMPIYNESPSRVFGTMEAIRASVEKTGLGEHFDFFLLSDTTNPDIWAAEIRTFKEIRVRLTGSSSLYYRRRGQNTAKKAGNIAEFVTKYGGAYDHMLVLDADSIMSGETIIRMTAAMESDPDSGIIQTLPLIVNRNTLFARLQQFAARIYGPVIAEGLSVWSGKDGNYWGHNAIIRMEAFAKAAGLPHLKGKPPFGGHIMSHDFVEAAFIRRAGYAVYMLPELDGSHEESPPSLIDLAARDRRWCQGNLQHMRVITASGLKMATRQHFATGIMSYLASPFWAAQLIVGLLLALQAFLIRPEYFRDEFALVPTWPRFDSERAVALFIFTMIVLLAPKVMGLIASMADQNVRKKAGGALMLTLSTLIETLMSALMAPIMMLIQSGAVLQILLGKDTGWQPQRRDDGSVPLKDIAKRHQWHLMFGLVGGAAIFTISPGLFAWMSPTLLGLVLAIPLSAATASLSAGLILRKIGLLTTPEETDVPAIVSEVNENVAKLEAKGLDETDALDQLHHDPAFRETLESMLTHTISGTRKKGVITPERAMAEAKLAEADTIDEAKAWLAPKEKVVAMSDRALIGIIARLENSLPSQV